MSVLVHVHAEEISVGRVHPSWPDLGSPWLTNEHLALGETSLALASQRGQGRSHDSHRAY